MKKAFTLAEVLITLAIIGVVAAMTIPTLISKYQDKAIITALKKFYSFASQAYIYAQTENGSPVNWGFSVNDSSKLIEIIEPYVKIVKKCSSGQVCHSASTILLKNNTVSQNYYFNPTFNRYAAVLSDGTVVGTYVYSDNCTRELGTDSSLKNVCGEYIIDVNGGNGPNQVGKDIYMFNITTTGIIPSGNLNYNSDTIIYYNFDTGCLDQNALGWGCTAWVLQNNNFDYFKCNDLSWNGKHSCNE